jgi:RNA polymerase sporulation-specific sigma factor
MVYKLAYNYSNYFNLDDLFQAGMIGLIKAYKKYDKTSSCKFSSYAYKYILGEMIDFIKKDRNIIVSDEIYNIYKKYLKVKELLSTKYERNVSIKEISAFMEIEENKLINIIEGVSFTSEIEYEFGDDKRESIDNKILLDEEISNLDLFSRNLINYRYYLGLSQNETADLLGVSQVKVSRSEKMILSKIRSNIAI